MKQKVSTGVAVLLVVALTAVSVNAYNDNKYEQRQAEFAQEQRLQKSVDAENLRKAKVTAEINRLQAECQKSLVTYTLLTKADQAKTKKPNCDLQFVE